MENESTLLLLPSCQTKTKSLTRILFQSTILQAITVAVQVPLRPMTRPHPPLL
jgi:hypothetical protein